MQTGHRSALVSCLLVAFAIACAHAGSHGQPVSGDAGRYITRDQIRQSGAVDAWQALRHFATYLEVRDNRRGDGGRVYQRGRGSFLLSNEVMLIVDEVQIADFQYLRNVPAETVEWIRVLTAPRAPHSTERAPATASSS
jgi:TonB-dependent Receptor Plug Domain